MHSHTRASKILSFLSIWLLLFAGGCSNPLSDTEHLARAKAFREKGDLRATMIELKSALQQNPGNIEARRLLGETYLKLGDGAAAEKELRRAIELGLEKEAVLLPLAEALQLQGKHQEILDEIGPAPSLPPRDQAVLAAYRGDAWLALRKPDKAKAEYERALRLDPASPRAKLGMAYLAAADNDTGAALNLLDEALRAAPDDGRLWRYKAELHRRRGELEAAEEAYGKAIESLPIKASARANRALVRIELNRLDAAAKDIEVLKKTAPKFHLTHFAEGYLKLARGDLKAAKEALEKALALNDRYPFTYFYLGLVHLRLGELEQADNRLTRFKAMMPGSPQGHQLLALVKYRQRDYDTARKLLMPVLLSKPDDLFALNLMANVEMAGGHVREGLEYLQKMAALKPESGVVQARLGTGLLLAGLKNEGLEALEKALAEDPELVQPNVLLAKIHIRDQNFAKAKQAIDRLRAALPGHPLPDNLEAMWHLAQGDEAKAKAALERAWELDPGNPNTGENLARLAFKNQRYDEVVRIYREVLKHHPDNALAQLRLAEMDFRRGDLKAMEARLTDLIRKQPDLLQPRLELAKYYLASGRPERSQTLLEEIRPRYPNSPELLAVLAKAQIEDRQGRRALDTTRALEKLAPRSPLTHHLLAQAHALNGDLKNMLAALEKSLALDPDFLPARLAKVKFLGLTQQTAEAQREMTQIAAQHPDNPQVLAMKGWLEMRQHHFEKAAESYRRALSLAPSSALVGQLATAQWRAGDRDGALETLEAWNRKYPQDARTHYLRAGFYRRLGRHQEAVAALKQALQIDPGSPRVLNDLAWLLRKEDPRQALAYAEKAYAKAPEDAGIVDTLAMTALENGNPERARTLLEKAVELAPQNPSIRYHLAQVQAKTGDRRQALENVEQALASKRPFPEREAAQRLQKELTKTP